MQHQELLAGLIRLHILHHAAEGEIYGVWIIEELARHGYRLSPGTLYPMLHAMEGKGYLRSREKRAGRSVRRLYRATPLGNKALGIAREKLRELVGELLEGTERARGRWGSTWRIRQTEKRRR
jgi:DNA-binding PadR family transcriptional regulator